MHDGCGCAHGETDMANTTDAPETTHDGAGGCGDACGCSGGAGAGQELHPMEAAALRGFLTGIHASRLDAEALGAYLAELSQDTGSEFARPAQFLGAQLQELASSGTLGTDPAAWSILDAITAEGDAADDLEDGEDDTEEDGEDAGASELTATA